MWYNSKVFHINARERGKAVNSYFELNTMPTIHHWKNLPSDRLFTELADCTATIHAISDDQKLIDFALGCLLSLTDASAGSIFIWDDAAKELVLRAAKGRYLNRVAGTRLKLREGVSGLVAERGNSVLVKNIKQDARFSAVKRSGKYQTGSFICLPMLADNKLVGVINITEKQSLEPFVEDDFERVSAIARHVAIAYENLKAEKRLWNENEELSDKVADLKETLKKQEPLVSIGKLAANLAHELNNPLDGIRRFINLSLDQVKEETLAKEYLLKARGGVRRAVQVIRGLLAFASQTSRQTVKTSEIRHVIEECIHTTRQNPSFQAIEFITHFDPSLIHVKDAGLATVFQNLFENACHAMNDSGKITVATKKHQDHVVISVSDTGHGIPEELRKRIFEPFYTTKPHGKGTGIGLSICRDVIERAGGMIEIESGLGQGTTFSIKIPFYSLID